MKRSFSAVIVLSLVFLLTATDAAAQRRIRFRRGSTSASVSGNIGVNRGVAGANYRSFVVRAGAGQTISATLSSGNDRVWFVENDQTSYTINTDRARDYVIRIYNGGANGTNYTLTVSIQ
ncbi:MAG TPA: hypothetical protein VJT74_15545 [Pyrinomonadaceae bacterium]|nr:hypothetical protein [Pyrinomonadaceae bacterium]